MDSATYQRILVSLLRLDDWLPADSPERTTTVGVGCIKWATVRSEIGSALTDPWDLYPAIRELIALGLIRKPWNVNRSRHGIRTQYQVTHIDTVEVRAALADLLRAGAQ
jgi:hypothetical protein